MGTECVQSQQSNGFIVHYVLLLFDVRDIQLENGADVGLSCQNPRIVPLDALDSHTHAFCPHTRTRDLEQIRNLLQINMRTNTSFVSKLQRELRTGSPRVCPRVEHT